MYGIHTQVYNMCSSRKYIIYIYIIYIYVHNDVHSGISRVRYDRGQEQWRRQPAERLYIMCTREASRRLYWIIIIIIIIVLVQAAAQPESERKNSANRIYETTWGRLRRHRGFMFLEWDKSCCCHTGKSRECCRKYLLFFYYPIWNWFRMTRNR